MPPLATSLPQAPLSPSRASSSASRPRTGLSALCSLRPVSIASTMLPCIASSLRSSRPTISAVTAPATCATVTYSDSALVDSTPQYSAQLPPSFCSMALSSALRDAGCSATSRSTRAAYTRILSRASRSSACSTTGAVLPPDRPLTTASHASSPPDVHSASRMPAQMVLSGAAASAASMMPKQVLTAPLLMSSVALSSPLNAW
mmetsp:Transcript_37614/g.94987  ORF Transcript_37614/g.94987 Transcript_37614/m.94987 type:complete len:203 (+) Transcript_37614:1339-1947(+)